MKQGGLISWANLIIATGQNNLAMNQTVLQIARHYVKGDKLKEGMLNRVEAGIRAYDPCLSCSTHAVGQMPMQVELVAADGALLDIGRAGIGHGDIDCPDSVLVIAWATRCARTTPWPGTSSRACARSSRAGRLPLMKLRHAHQLAPEMAECVSKAQGVVFIDARRDGQPGEVRCEEIAPTTGSNPLAHSIWPQALLLFAEQLYGRAPKAVVLSIAGERFGMGEALSPVVRRAIPRAIRTVVRQAKAWSAATPQTVQPG